MELGPLQRKWIDALRSGEYAQGAKYLCHDGKYCCLGVANKVCGLGETSPYALNNTYSSLGLYGNIGDIDGDGIPVKTSICYTLTEANDQGLTFAEIADFIEKNPEKVFERAV